MFTGDAVLARLPLDRHAEAWEGPHPVEKINETPIAYEMTGEGEPLVLVHGTWVDGHTWDLVVPRLAESFFVITYDLRGHGRSVINPPSAGTVHDDVADLAALIDRLEIGPANVAGNSSVRASRYGSPSSIPTCAQDARPRATHGRAACRRPQCEGDRRPESRIDWSAPRAARGRIQREAAERFVDTVAIGPGAWSQLPPPVQDTFVRHGPAFLGQLNDPDALQLDLDALGEVSTPLLLSQGDQSPPMFPPIMDQLAANVPKAERRTLTNAGHVPHMTNPDDYVALLTGFIQG